MPNYSHCEIFSSEVQSESPQDLLIPIPPCLFQCKKGLSILLVVILCVPTQSIQL